MDPASCRKCSAAQTIHQPDCNAEVVVDRETSNTRDSLEIKEALNNPGDTIESDPLAFLAMQEGRPNSLGTSEWESELLKKYRVGMDRIVGFGMLSTLYNLWFTVYFFLLFNNGEEEMAIPALVSGFFGLAWSVCAILCARNVIWPAYLIGGICVLDVMWAVADALILAPLIFGLMIWNVSNTTYRARDLLRRGVDLSRRR